MRGLRNVNIAVQMSEKGHKTCKAIKINTSNEVLPGQTGRLDITLHELSKFQYEQ
jgi:hypothetical protein